MPVRIAGAGCCLMDLLFPDADFSSPAFLGGAVARRGGRGAVAGAPGFLRGRRALHRPALCRNPRRDSGLGDSGCREGRRGCGGSCPGRNEHRRPLCRFPHPRRADAGGRGRTGGFSRRHGRRRDRPRAARAARAHAPGRLAARDEAGADALHLRPLGSEMGRRTRGALLRQRHRRGGGLLPSDLDAGFFDADIIALGGTALVPRLHEGLPGLLAKARSQGALTVVNTVFDFRAESGDAIGPWPFGGQLPPPGSSGRRAPGPLEAYRACDLLIMDKEEALRLSGESDLGAALAFLERCGVGAFAVTRGPESVLVSGGTGEILAAPLRELPVSARSGRVARGDTTGCGDAFAGGILAAVALQLKAGATALDLIDAVSWGIAAGAFTLGILGGTYYETRSGEKREAVDSIRGDWLVQIRGS